MTSFPSVVPGEAPESDDEGQPDKQSTDDAPFTRSIVFGEAPESSSSSSSNFQEEIKNTGEVSETAQPVGNTPRPNTTSNPSTPLSPSTDVREKVLRTIRAQRKDSAPSLLFTKLRENNISLRSSLTDFVRQTAQQTSKEINAIDHELLRSQMTLQEATTAYRQMNKNVKDINTALCLSPSLNGIPEIDIRAVL